MDFAALLQAIQTVGLPIVMVIWFMWRTEGVVERNTQALHALLELEGRELELMRALFGHDLTKGLRSNQEEKK